jgi:penicillin-binding protein 2
MQRLLPFQGWRLSAYQIVVILVLGIFVLRLYEYQVLRYDEFSAQADENRLSRLPIASDRGAIFDRNDLRLAFNVPAYLVTIVPASLPARRDEELAVFNRLSALVNVPPTREVARASGRNVRSIEEIVAEGEGIAPFREVIVATDIPLDVAVRIREERIYMPGVDVQAIAVREYPTGALTSHVIGYMGPIPADQAQALREQGYNPAFDRIGYEGIEAFLERDLSGTRGSELREVDVAGEVLRVVEQIDPIPGQNVRLTIDTELQAAATESLEKWLQFRNDQPGSADKGLSYQGVVIAMDPRTGEVLSLVSLPTYDNSRFSRAIDAEYYFELVADPTRPLVNNAIKGLYPPGSVWKVVTMAGAMAEEVIDPATQLVDEGQILLENRYAPNDPAASQRFVCWLREGHGLVNAVQSMAWSCDVYFYQIGGGNDRLSPQVLRPGGLGIGGLFRHATATGIGSELGIELPFENAGRMPDPDWKRRNLGENWSTGDTYNAAFGQGYITTTPLQLLAQTASLINGGVFYQPTLIREFLDEQRNILRPFAPQVMRTLNPDDVPPDEDLVLFLLEDMLMKGETSLACICEPNSPYYDSNRCDPEGYRNTVDTNSDPFVENLRQYRVHIPYNYVFNGSVCQPIRFSNPNNPYRPAFVTTEALEIVREGTLAATTIEGGTALSASLDFVQVAGKTGTAEYCDDVARPLGYCVPGQWPAHAWYVGYAPYEDPEIIIIAFVYNGGEGSRIALPIVKETMEAYYRLKSQRETSGP